MACQYELSYKIELDQKSSASLEKFINDNKETKEVDVHEVYALLARALLVVGSLKTSKGKKLNEDQQRQVMARIYDQLVKDDANNFKDDGKLGNAIDLVFKMNNGEFSVNFGRSGLGCLPCCSSVTLSAKN